MNSAIVGLQQFLLFIRIRTFSSRASNFREKVLSSCKAVKISYSISFLVRFSCGVSNLGISREDACAMSKSSCSIFQSLVSLKYNSLTITETFKRRFVSTNFSIAVLQFVLQVVDRILNHHVSSIFHTIQPKLFTLKFNYKMTWLSCTCTMPCFVKNFYHITILEFSFTHFSTKML